MNQFNQIVSGCWTVLANGEDRPKRGLGGKEAKRPRGVFDKHRSTALASSNRKEESGARRPLVTKKKKQKNTTFARTQEFIMKTKRYLCEVEDCYPP